MPEGPILYGAARKKARRDALIICALTLAAFAGLAWAFFSHY